MNPRFSGKLALIAGGTGALGRTVSMAFLNEGAKVVVTYREQKEFDDLQHAAGTNASSSLQGQQVDVTDDTALNQFVQRLVAEYSSLDIVVNTVGAYAGGMKLWDLDPKVFDQMLALNLRAGFLISRAVVPQMLKQRHGAIVNIASKAAFEHAAGAAAYAASKAAAVAMMDSLAADLQGTGVRVNSILPSIIDTEANRTAMPKADFSQWPKPEDIAPVILFLCSEEAKLIHGAAVPVYGNS
jgi:NAD(P)-dependent dehydrogenase (short-subunit alcohol dehydrogenase family)